MGWAQVQANVNVIVTEIASRSRYRTSAHEESSMKLTKNTSTLHSPEKNQVFSSLA